MIRHLKELEERFLCATERSAPSAGALLRRYARVCRFIVSGGTAAVVDLGLLYLFTDGFGWHYLVSAVLAFLASFFVSFFLQKFWTFQDNSTDRVQAQLSISFGVGTVNLLLNTALMYFFVDLLSVWYFAAQIIVGIILAFESFFISRYFIFKKSNASSHHNPDR